MDRPLDQQAFMAELKAVGEPRYHYRHPFNLRMYQGLLVPKEIQCWIINRVYYQQAFPAKDALIIARLPAPEYRRLWLPRILTQDGARAGEGEIEAWLQLGEAAGLDRENMLAVENVLPGVRMAVDAWVSFCRERTWLEGVATSLTEYFAPDLMNERVDVFRKHYNWVEPEGLDSFEERVDEHRRDAEHALQLVLAAAKTRALQKVVINAFLFKCEVLWTMLDAIERESSTGLTLVKRPSEL